MIYLAPLQGYTDFIYRKAFSSVFQGIDGFFIPYISVKNGEVLKKYIAEISPENNPQQRIIPQILAKDENEIVFLSKVLEYFGYKEANLNLGCPYPMVTNRGKGAGLLPHPEKIKKILDTFYKKTNLQLSVKMRAGLENESEIENVLPVLNSFPLTEIILHSRIAKQLYKGNIINSTYYYAEKSTNHKLIYNGDIFSISDFKEKQVCFTNTSGWMLGRGILMNPFLPSEIKGLSFTTEEKKTKIAEFHELILESTLNKMDNVGNTLNKMKQLWVYFSFNFENQEKVFKQIKKTNSLSLYVAEANNIFRNHIK